MALPEQFFARVIALLPLCVRAQWLKRVGVSGRLLLEVCVVAGGS